ncbi:hypothetical protein FO519_008248, partial [Halicephalobus sp. NKZ332]
IADQKPAQIRLFDYYDPEQQMKTSYSARQSRSLSDSCPDCWSSPESENGVQTSSSSRVRASSNRANCGFSWMSAMSVPLSWFLFRNL